MTSRTIDWAGHDSEGNKVSGTVTVEVGTTQQTETLLGVSMSRWDHGVSQVDAATCYTRGDVDQAADDYDAKMVLYSGPIDASPTAVRNDINAIKAAHPGLQGVYFPGNEVDRHKSGPQITPYLANVRAVSPVVRALGWLMGINLTRDGIRTGAIDAFKLGPDVLDVQGINAYPPGRKKTVTDPHFDEYPDFIDDMLEWVAATGVRGYVCRETGIPVDPNDPAHRPEWAGGLPPYIVTKAAALGITVVALTWWDSVLLANGQPDPKAPDNRLQRDGTATVTQWLGALT